MELSAPQLIAAVIAIGSLSMAFYGLFGVAFVVFAFDLGFNSNSYMTSIQTPGLWTDFLRDEAKRRPRMIRMLVFIAWPLHLAILILLLPLEAVRGLNRLFSNGAKR